MDFSLLGLWNQMGLVAKGVVVLLIAMSMYAIGIGLERFMTYRRGRARSIAFIAALEPLIRSREKLDDNRGDSVLRRLDATNAVLHEMVRNASGCNFYRGKPWSCEEQSHS